jgi:hypothetical protein
MLGKPDYLDHTESSTLLIAPQSFKVRFEQDCSLFDVFISYEDIARFLPDFLSADAAGKTPG